MAVDSGADQKQKRRHAHPVNRLIHEEATLRERVADRTSAVIGSWRFLIIQSALITLWICFNVFALVHHWDPYPFFLLNFAFSFQAAFTGPVLLLAGNRQAQKDRLMLEHTAEESETSEKTTIEILEEIERNTACTLDVLKRVRAQRLGQKA
jgi:uncharacterized membrane protein